MITISSRQDRSRFDAGKSEAHEDFLYQDNEDSSSVLSFACESTLGESMAELWSSSCLSRPVERRKLNDLGGKEKRKQRSGSKKKNGVASEYHEDGFSVSSLEIEIDMQDETRLSNSRFIDGSARYGTVDMIPAQPLGRNRNIHRPGAFYRDEEKMSGCRSALRNETPCKMYPQKAILAPKQDQ